MSEVFAYIDPTCKDRTSFIAPSSWALYKPSLNLLFFIQQASDRIFACQLHTWQDHTGVQALTRLPFIGASFLSFATFALFSATIGGTFTIQVSQVDLLLGQPQVQHMVLKEVGVQLGAGPKDQRTIKILIQAMAAISVFFFFEVLYHTRDSHPLASSYFGFHSTLAPRLRNQNQSVQLRSPPIHH